MVECDWSAGHFGTSACHFGTCVSLLQTILIEVEEALRPLSTLKKMYEIFQPPGWSAGHLGAHIDVWFRPFLSSVRWFALTRGIKVKMRRTCWSRTHQLPSAKQKCIVLISRYYVDLSKIKFRLCNNMFSILSPKCRFKVPSWEFFGNFALKYLCVCRYIRYCYLLVHYVELVRSIIITV